VHGAFEPATGEAAMVVSGKRDSTSHIALLERMVEIFTSRFFLRIDGSSSKTT
jgi:hypothetical protein